MGSIISKREINIEPNEPNENTPLIRSNDNNINKEDLESNSVQNGNDWIYICF